MFTMSYTHNGQKVEHSCQRVADAMEFVLTAKQGGTKPFTEINLYADGIENPIYTTKAHDVKKVGKHMYYGEKVIGDYTSQGYIYCNEEAYFDRSVPLFYSEADFNGQKELHHDVNDKKHIFEHYLEYAKECIKENFDELSENQVDFYAYMLLFSAVEWSIEEGWCSLETRIDEMAESIEIEYVF